MGDSAGKCHAANAGPRGAIRLHLTAAHRPETTARRPSREVGQRARCDARAANADQGGLGLTPEERVVRRVYAGAHRRSVGRQAIAGTVAPRTIRRRAVGGSRTGRRATAAPGSGPRCSRWASMPARRCGGRRAAARRFAPRSALVEARGERAVRHAHVDAAGKACARLPPERCRVHTQAHRPRPRPPCTRTRRTGSP